MVTTHYSTLLGFSLNPSFHRCEMIEMGEQSLADIFCPSIMDFIERKPDSEVDFDVDRLLRKLPDIDLQLDSDRGGSRGGSLGSNEPPFLLIRLTGSLLLSQQCSTPALACQSSLATV